MENPLQNDGSSLTPPSNSRKTLRLFFSETLRELYFCETIISTEFGKIKQKIESQKLESILQNHFMIHLRHKERLEKIFQMQNESLKPKECPAIIALLNDANEHFKIFSDDIVNWEIALILTSRKLAHYKIAAYGAAAHLAINLNNHAAATLLAIDVQEEEEFIEKYLNDLTYEFLKPYRP